MAERLIRERAEAATALEALVKERDEAREALSAARNAVLEEAAGVADEMKDACAVQDVHDQRMYEIVSNSIAADIRALKDKTQ